MVTPQTESLAALIEAARQGQPGASQRLFEIAYADLRALAAAIMRDERPGQTLQPTALVHEAFLKVTGGSSTLAAQDRRHLFGIFANAMRQILIDAARRKGAIRHGGGRRRVAEISSEAPAEAEPEDFVELGELLDRLQALDPRAAETVRLKVFAGLDMETVAELLETSKRSVERDWQFARLWLQRELRAASGE